MFSETTAGGETSNSSGGKGGKGGGRKPPGSSPALPPYSPPAAPSVPSSVPAGTTAAPAEPSANFIQSLLAGAASTTVSGGYDLSSVEKAKSALDEALEVVNQPRARDDYLYTGTQVTPGKRTGPRTRDDYLRTGEASLTPTQQVEAAATALRQAERGQREQAIGSNVQGPFKAGTPAPGAAGGQVDQMTQEEYDALTDKQRAAVDFNTMLVKAVRKDNRLQDEYDPNETQRMTYDASVEKMFGEGRDSALYAPETMSVLRQIGFDDTSADLDDFLGLNAAITMRDLKHLKSVAGPTVRETTLNPVELDRYELTESLASNTASMQAALVRGNQLLATIQQTAVAGRADDVTRLGGIYQAPQGGLGYEAPVFSETGAPGDLNTYFQVAYDKMTQRKPGATPDEMLQTFQTDLSPSEFRAFMGYVDARSSSADRYGIELGDNPDAKYKSPDEFREIFGLGGGDNAAR